MRKAYLILWLEAIFLVFGVVNPYSARADVFDGEPEDSKRSKSPAEKAERIVHSLKNVPFEKYRLKNGLQVILSEDHHLPSVAINVLYSVGPTDERPGRTGFAHLFEHLMFEGSKHVKPGDHTKLLEAAGASEINAITDFDYTEYFETVPSNQLELALWLESDRMGFLYDSLDSEKLARQRDIVRNERREKIDNNPYGLLEEATIHKLFSKGHPYSADVQGSHADIEAARLSELRQFFKQFYCPNNASLCIAGDFDRTKTKALIEKYFSSLPAKTMLPKLEVKTQTIGAERRAVLGDQVENSRVCIAWITAPYFSAGDAEADLIAYVLGQGRTGRLYKKLIGQLSIAQSVSVTNNSHRFASIFFIEVTGKPGVSPETLEKAVNDELAVFRHIELNQEQLDAARNSIETNFVLGLERIGGPGGRAHRLNFYNSFLGDPGMFLRELERYDKVSLFDFKRTLQEYFLDRSRVVVYSIPGKKVTEDVPKVHAEEDIRTDFSATTPSDEPWRNIPPKPGGRTGVKLPVPVSFRLPNGLTVYLLEKHDLPLLITQMTLKSGSACNPITKSGLSVFTNGMLQGQTANRTEAQISTDLANAGALTHAYCTEDASMLGVVSLTRSIHASLDILADMVQNPAFDSQEIERLRSLLLSKLTQQSDDSDVLAQRALLKALYGKQNPYGYPCDGTLNSIKAISRDDIVSLWKNTYTPANACLIFVGDLKSAEARQLAKAYFGNWKGSAPFSYQRKLDRQDTPALYFVNKSAASQSVLALGAIGMARSSSDYLPSELMNKVLGGTFSSRLNTNLRVNHAYTYQVGSNFSYRCGPGPFMASTSVPNAASAEALLQLFDEIERVSITPFSKDELKMARTNFIQSQLAQFSDSQAEVACLGDIFVYRLPLNYYRTLPKRTEAVSEFDLARVARKYLDLSRMVGVVVGDKTEILPQLEKLKRFDKIVELDAEGNPLK